ncbi:hypothetical protein BD410DRAFT_842113 [Rickenella mellea]|uniref:Uncharacterized protein n=1 Tax=Rickenella mellea TaxID=50990 RepID=A0A4Y7PXR3_9AGAM|nr:hypothetical protein BD410DRAFT_842113 [Rickenella mellea]
MRAYAMMQAPPLPEPPSNSVGTVSGADWATTQAPPLPEPPSRSLGTEVSWEDAEVEEVKDMSGKTITGENHAGYDGGMILQQKHADLQG